MAAYIDLSEKHGHRDDHGFACGAEFNVKIRRRIDIPDFVREQLSESEIDSVWWEEAGQVRDSLKDTLQRRYKWIGELAFVGRGPGWLAIEDTECDRLTEQLAFKGKSRNWDTIGKVVDQHLKNFIKSMESPRFWRDIKGVSEQPQQASDRHHSTRKSSAQLQREIDEMLAKPVTASIPPTRAAGIKWGTTSTPRLWRGTGRKATYEINQVWPRQKRFFLSHSGDPQEREFSSLRAAKAAAAQLDQR